MGISHLQRADSADDIASFPAFLLLVYGCLYTLSYPSLEILLSVVPLGRQRLVIKEREEHQ